MGRNKTGPVDEKGDSESIPMFRFCHLRNLLARDVYISHRILLITELRQKKNKQTNEQTNKERNNRQPSIDSQTFGSNDLTKGLQIPLKSPILH